MMMRLVLRERWSKGAMRRIPVVDDDVLIGQAIHAWLKQHGYSASTAGSGALCKPFKPSALLGVIDDCLSEAEPYRRYVTALGALCEPRGGDGVIREDLIREDLQSKSETQGTRANQASN
jgi:hypothetical protein